MARAFSLATTMDISMDQLMGTEAITAPQPVMTSAAETGDDGQPSSAPSSAPSRSDPSRSVPSIAPSRRDPSIAPSRPAMAFLSPLLENGALPDQVLR